MQSLADLDEQTLSRCLPDMDSHDLTLCIRQMEPPSQKTILEKVGRILGENYAEILKLAVLQG
jgi:hypothetical protein